MLNLCERVSLVFVVKKRRKLIWDDVDKSKRFPQKAGRPPRESFRCRKRREEGKRIFCTFWGVERLKVCVRFVRPPSNAWTSTVFAHFVLPASQFEKNLGYEELVGGQQLCDRRDATSPNYRHFVRSLCCGTRNPQYLCFLLKRRCKIWTWQPLRTYVRLHMAFSFCHYRSVRCKAQAECTFPDFGRRSKFTKRYKPPLPEQRDMWRMFPKTKDGTKLVQLSKETKSIFITTLRPNWKSDNSIRTAAPTLPNTRDEDVKPVTAKDFEDGLMDRQNGGGVMVPVMHGRTDWWTDRMGVVLLFSGWDSSFVSTDSPFAEYDTSFANKTVLGMFLSHVAVSQNSSTRTCTSAMACCCLPHNQKSTRIDE